jgi:hypothetical protein
MGDDTGAAGGPGGVAGVELLARPRPTLPLYGMGVIGVVEPVGDGGGVRDDIAGDGEGALKSTTPEERAGVDA